MPPVCCQQKLWTAWSSRQAMSPHDHFWRTLWTGQAGMHETGLNIGVWWLRSKTWRPRQSNVYFWSIYPKIMQVSAHMHPNLKRLDLPCLLRSWNPKLNRKPILQPASNLFLKTNCQHIKQYPFCLLVYYNILMRSRDMLQKLVDNLSFWFESVPVGKKKD